MQQLQFVALDEGGRLVVSAEDGTRYAVPVDDHLRAALRPRPLTTRPERTGAPAITPRDLQSMIRAGQTPDEVAASTGWAVERVRRFEGPVLAEREHVVGLAQRAHVRAHGRTDGTHTLDQRVRERLQTRDVDLTAVTWDATRSTPQGPWTVLVIFTAGGKERRAAWHYNVQDRSIEALDDEARWLSEDELALPGGLAGHPLLGTSHVEDEAAADLMATMRERRQRRSRRTTRKEPVTGDPSHVPGQQAMPEEVLPLDELHYDPETMGDPPPAHPRGSAPEAVVPVGPEPDEVVQEVPDAADNSDAGAERETEQKASRKKAAAKRRRLRMPKLPPAVGAPVEQDDEPEVSYARTQRDPHEVTFDEFFGTEDDADDEMDDELDDQPDGELEEQDEAEIKPEAEGSAPQPTSDAESETETDGAETKPEPKPQDETGSDAGAEAASAEPTGSDEPTSTPRKSRTSVPSWDDIMFGARERRG